MSFTEKQRTTMRLNVNELRNSVDNFECNINQCKYQIDWGPKKRGQGRRSGGTIVGSMSAVPVGVKTYYGIDYSEYIEHKDDIKNLELYQVAKYIKARKFGLTHWESMYYALS